MSALRLYVSLFADSLNVQSNFYCFCLGIRYLYRKCRSLNWRNPLWSCSVLEVLICWLEDYYQANRLGGPPREQRNSKPEPFYVKGRWFVDSPFSGYKLPSQVKLDSFHVILSSITGKSFKNFKPTPLSSLHSQYFWGFSFRVSDLRYGEEPIRFNSYWHCERVRAVFPYCLEDYPLCNLNFARRARCFASGILNVTKRLWIMNDIVWI